MRIIAGTLRRSCLKTPEGLETRPTSDRIKETLFNVIQPLLLDCVFVDLFSGSGGIGLEALSRGAKICYFVEKNSPAYFCIQDNIAFTKMQAQSVVLKQDASFSISNSIKEEADIIFMDPPYGQEHEKKILELLANSSIMKEDTLIIVESSLDTDFSYVDELNLEVTKEKKYKTNKHVFIYRKEIIS